MKLQYLFLACLFLLACGSEPKKVSERELSPAENKTTSQQREIAAAPWDLFWTDFQDAVVRGDVEEVRKHIVFPLKGSEPFNDGKQISAATFDQHYSKIFDETAVAKFKEGVENMSEFSTKNPTVANQLNVPANTKVRTTMILYVTNKGKENQTESSVTLQFVEVEPGEFKLYSLVVAG